MQTISQTRPSPNFVVRFFQSRFWRRLSKRKSALVGLVVVLFMVFIALFAPLLAPMIRRLKAGPPCARHHPPFTGSAQTKPVVTSCPALSGARALH